MKSWLFVNEPSHIVHEVQALARIRPIHDGLLIASFLALATVWCARLYQAELAPVVGTAKYPESLCPRVAFPPLGKRFPFPPRTLLPVLRSLWTHAPIPVANLSFGYSPRSRSLGRLLPAPAANGIFPTLFCKSFPRCLVPYPDGPLECFCLFLPQGHRPSQRH